MNSFELQHLRNLAAGDTRQYVGCGSLRAELRKFRDLGLIEKLGNHHIGELYDQRRFDLKTFVRLTDRGTRYLTRLEEYQVPGA